MGHPLSGSKLFPCRSDIIHKFKMFIALNNDFSISWKHEINYPEPHPSLEEESLTEPLM